MAWPIQLHEVVELLILEEVLVLVLELELELLLLGEGGVPAVLEWQPAEAS